MSYCDDVVSVHRQAGGAGRGRRGAEASLNRAVVVMAMAGWQTAVEGMVRASLRQAEAYVVATPGIVITAYANQVRGAVDRFSTPNSSKCRELFRSVGYDPQPNWVNYVVRGANDA